MSHSRRRSRFADQTPTQALLRKKQYTERNVTFCHSLGVAMQPPGFCQTHACVGACGRGEISIRQTIQLLVRQLCDMRSQSLRRFGPQSVKVLRVSSKGKHYTDRAHGLLLCNRKPRGCGFYCRAKRRVNFNRCTDLASMYTSVDWNEFGRVLS